MKEHILIVEDQFVEADYLRLLLETAGYAITGIARSVADAQVLINYKKPDFVLLDIFLKGKQTGIDLAKLLAADNIPFVYLSANSNEQILNAAKETQPYGFLVKPFREKDLLVAIEIARYRHAHSMEAKYRKEAVFRNVLKTIESESGAWREKLLGIATALHACIPFDFLAVGFDDIQDTHSRGVCFFRIGFDEYQVIGLPELATITGKKREELMVVQRNDKMPELFAATFQLRSRLAMPLHIMDRQPFGFCLYSRSAGAYGAEQVELFERIRFSLVQAMEQLLAQEKSDETRLPRQHKTRQGFEGIVGKSHLLLNVFDHVVQAAPGDTSVLILGESGTGKERIATCIHELSARKGKPFVKLNCAALPASLIESELFGHEKGAFTGAHEKRIGKFERADKGTLFLDEVGEMPVELQVKLLRVLQEKEIERVGGRETIQLDVRIIAATNKNLEREVAEGRFRLDLYYRLNVFPIMLPPLRERVEDIPALAYHFVHYYGQKAGKKIGGITDGVLRKMMGYNWPGNIRELEHLVERSVLLAKGKVIDEILLPVGVVKYEDEQVIKTIAENERDYIIAVLKKCNGRIWGPGAAAEVLNINPSTLKSKMKKLGIKKEYIS